MIKSLVGIFSNEIQQSELVAGDHIYSYRKSWGYLYAHHGIYVGGGRVIHFMGDPTLMMAVSGGEAVLSPYCATCGFHGKLVGVVHSCIPCFLKGGVLRRFRYSATLVERITALRSGCCSTLPSDPAPLVLARAHLFLLRRSFLRPYHLFLNNCLHFALFCKLGSNFPSSSSSSPLLRLFLLLASSCSCFLLFDYFYHDFCDSDYSLTDIPLYLTSDCDCPLTDLPLYPYHHASDCDYSLTDLPLFPYNHHNSGTAKPQPHDDCTIRDPPLYPYLHYSISSIPLYPDLHSSTDNKRQDLVAETTLRCSTLYALISKLLFQSPHLHQP